MSRCRWPGCTRKAKNPKGDPPPFCRRHAGRFGQESDVRKRAGK